MSTVKSIINEWDPIGLLAHAPDDEYHSEIDEIKHLLKNTSEVNNLSNGIFEIFTKSFGKDTFTKTKMDCHKIATAILKNKI